MDQGLELDYHQDQEKLFQEIAEKPRADKEREQGKDKIFGGLRANRVRKDHDQSTDNHELIS